MPLKRSTAKLAAVRCYTEGMCHVFALALHRRFGWKLLVVTNTEGHYWINPLDESDYLPSVVHVYALDPELNAWDVLGVRPLNKVQDELRMGGEYDSITLNSEEELKPFVGFWGKRQSGTRTNSN